jgi:hypothetical protein
MYPEGFIPPEGVTTNAVSLSLHRGKGGVNGIYRLAEIITQGLVGTIQKSIDG